MPALLIREVAYAGETTDLLVREGTVTVALTAVLDDVDVIDGRGLTAIPGLIDVHVHFRDPGLTEKEDMLSGARAAAAGGFTTVLCEPNTRPVMDNAAMVKAWYIRARELGMPISVWTKGAVTLGQTGETLTDIPALAQAGIVAVSDDGEPLVDHSLLVQAFRASALTGNTLVLTAHCEETPRSAGKVRMALGDGTVMGREVELIGLHLAALAEAGVGRLHIQHVSLAASAVLLAEAKRRGMAVTAEVTPHHLLLCQEDIPVRGGEHDPNWKMNPPLRRREDMQAMRRALAEGIIDMIATDHAPHTPAEKAQPWEQAPFGIIGLETALGAGMTLVHAGTISLDRLVEAMSLRPATLLPDWARSSAGDLTLIDPCRSWSIDPETFYSKGRNCPFAGIEFAGKAIYTIVNGQPVMAEGTVLF